jgi:hypothetical protein
MIVINNETAELEIKELFSFDVNAFPVFDEIKSDVEYKLENNEFDDDEIESVKYFLSHEISKDDKVSILNEIKFEYEYRYNRSDNEISLFDVDVIKSAIKSWVESNFDFPLYGI